MKFTEILEELREECKKENIKYGFKDSREMFLLCK